MDYTLQGAAIGLQVSYINTLPESYEPKKPFYIKNTSQDLITLEVKPFHNNGYILTTVFPGWNPELIIAVRGNDSNFLQYGR